MSTAGHRRPHRVPVITAVVQFFAAPLGAAQIVAGLLDLNPIRTAMGVAALLCWYLMHSNRRNTR